MNALKSTIYVAIRGYARQSSGKSKFSKNQSRFEMPPEKQLYPDVNEYNYDPHGEYDDFDGAESDFSNVGQSYTEHMREMRHQKALLKKKIIERKYFKSNDPNFITWAEKDQIQTLHARDSVEWTPERLSESFPALPDTIRRILRAKWLSKSVEAVVKHDQGVIDNWKLFKTGSLAVDPQLESHLKKFKDRKIEITSLAAIAEKFVKKPPVFPAPKSTMFSSIIKGCVELAPKKEENNQRQITAGSEKNESSEIRFRTSDKSNKHVTFDTFLNTAIDKFAGDTNLSLEKQLLVDEYKQQKSIEAFDNNDSTVVQSPVEKLSTTVTTIVPSTRMKTVQRVDMKMSSVDTGVLEWKKKELSTDGDYPDFIKIPRTKAQTGVTFRVKDRYYDSDGEFLYRVSGLKM